MKLIKQIVKFNKQYYQLNKSKIYEHKKEYCELNKDKLSKN